MNLFGDSSEWDDYFEYQLIPTILDLVLDAWATLSSVVGDEKEDTVTDRLYAALRRCKLRNSHPFQVHIQPAEFDMDTGAIVGWKDIAFFPPSNDEEIYFCLEAKRLNAVVSGKITSLASKYVSDGMQRFIDRKYSPHVRHGGMVGYVLDGDLERAIANVANCIQLHYIQLKMQSPGVLAASSVRPYDGNAKETQHQREGEIVDFRLHHLFVASADL